MLQKPMPKRKKAPLKLRFPAPHNGVRRPPTHGHPNVAISVVQQQMTLPAIERL